jgi:hypothetical protein
MNQRPKCPNCGGPLQADRDIYGKTISVKCILCSHRIYRGFNTRPPTKAERGVREGICHTSTIHGSRERKGAA